MNRIIIIVVLVTVASKGFAQQFPSVDYFIQQLGKDTVNISDTLRALGFTEEPKIARAKHCSCGDLMKSDYRSYYSRKFTSDSITISICMRLDEVASINIDYAGGRKYVNESVDWMGKNGFTQDPNSSTTIQSGDICAWNGSDKKMWYLIIFKRSLTKF